MCGIIHIMSHVNYTVLKTYMSDLICYVRVYCKTPLRVSAKDWPNSCNIVMLPDPAFTEY